LEKIEKMIDEKFSLEIPQESLLQNGDSRMKLEKKSILNF